MHTTHRIGSLAALAAAMADAAGPLVYPCPAMLENSAWRYGVEPELCAVVPGNGGQTAVTIRDAGQLTRVVGNVEQLNSLAQWDAGVGLNLVLDIPAGPSAEAVQAAEAWAVTEAQAVAAQAVAPVAQPEPEPTPAPAQAASPATQQQQQNGQPGKRGGR